MTKLHALRFLALFGLLIAVQCFARPELWTAWIVAGCAIALLAITAGIAVLLSGQYRGK